jgi:hypothetical protein
MSCLLPLYHQHWARGRLALEVEVKELLTVAGRDELF